MSGSKGLVVVHLSSIIDADVESRGEGEDQVHKVGAALLNPDMPHVRGFFGKTDISEGGQWVAGVVAAVMLCEDAIQKLKAQAKVQGVDLEKLEKVGGATLMQKAGDG